MEELKQNIGYISMLTGDIAKEVGLTPDFGMYKGKNTDTPEDLAQITNKIAHCLLAIRKQFDIKKAICVTVPENLEKIYNEIVPETTQKDQISK